MMFWKPYLRLPIWRHFGYLVVNFRGVLFCWSASLNLNFVEHSDVEWWKLVKTNMTMENHHFQWEIHLQNGWISIVMVVFWAGCCHPSSGVGLPGSSLSSLCLSQRIWPEPNEEPQEEFIIWSVPMGAKFVASMNGTNLSRQREGFKG